MEFPSNLQNKLLIYSLQELFTDDGKIYVGNIGDYNINVMHWKVDLV